MVKQGGQKRAEAIQYDEYQGISVRQVTVNKPGV